MGTVSEKKKDLGCGNQHSCLSNLKYIYFFHDGSTNELIQESGFCRYFQSIYSCFWSLSYILWDWELRTPWSQSIALSQKEYL